MRKFTACQSGFIDGTWYDKGSPVPLNERQARWHELEGRVQEASDADSGVQGEGGDRP